MFNIIRDNSRDVFHTADTIDAALKMIKQFAAKTHREVLDIEVDDEGGADVALVRDGRITLFAINPA